MTSGVPRDHQPRTATTAATACRRDEGRPGPGPVAAGRRRSQGSLSCCQRIGTVPVARPPAKETGQADAPQLRHHLGDVGRSGAHLSPYRARRPIDEGPYDLHPGPERGRALTLMQRAPRNQTSACPSQRGNLLGRPRLSHAGFARQQHDAPVPPRGSVESGGQRRHLDVTTNEACEEGS